MNTKEWIGEITKAQMEFMRNHISRQEFIETLKLIDYKARFDFDITSNEYDLIKAVYKVAKLLN